MIISDIANIRDSFKNSQYNIVIMLDISPYMYSYDINCGMPISFI